MNLKPICAATGATGAANGANCLRLTCPGVLVTSETRWGFVISRLEETPTSYIRPNSGLSGYALRRLCCKVAVWLIVSVPGAVATGSRRVLKAKWGLLLFKEASRSRRYRSGYWHVRLLQQSQWNQL